MIQHVLLLVVAAPLFVRRVPVDPPVALPAAGDAPLARARSRPRASARRRCAVLSRTLGRPVPSFVAFSVVLLAWHVPALFDATLRSGTLHAFEHTLFFCTALLFWKQVIPSPPLRARLRRVAARRLPDRRHDRQLGPRGRARARAAPAVQLLRAPVEPPRRDLGDGRPAARRRRHVGAGLGHVPRSSSSSMSTAG